MSQLPLQETKGYKLIDISENQGHIDFGIVKAENPDIKGIYAKATEGRTIQDAKYREYHDGAKSAGIDFGPYHFFHFASSTPEDQYANFKSVTDGYTGQLVPMIDVEGASQDGITNVGVLVHRLSQFLQLIEKDLNGKKAIIYSGYSFWQDVMGGTDCFSGHVFWEAEYSNQASPDIAKGFKSVSIWQKQDNLPVKGISSPVDGDELLIPIEAIERI